VLPTAHRLTEGETYARVTRRGRRAGTPTLVAHLLTEGEGEVRAGFVVSRAVGNAVVRTRVKRRLRHLVRDRLDSLPGGSLLVVRALPPSADASSRTLGADLDRALERLGSEVRA
jgi:ribonuclease P protein component